MESRTLTPIYLTPAEIAGQGLIVLAEQHGDGQAQFTQKVVEGIVKDDMRANSPWGQKVLKEIVQDKTLFFQHKLVPINVVGDKNHRCIAVPEAHYQPWLVAAQEEWSRSQEPVHPLQESAGYCRAKDRFPSGTFGRLGGSKRPRGFIC